MISSCHICGTYSAHSDLLESAGPKKEYTLCNSLLYHFSFTSLTSSLPRFKYFPQHSSIKYAKYTFFSHPELPRVTLVQNWYIYTALYLML
jgi:hypothetical protein